MRPSRGLVPSPRKSPSKQRSSAHSAAAGEECYELQAVPSVIPALQAISAVRRAGALMARVMSPTADRIEGELWYIAGEYGPGKGNAAAPQWVTCDRHRLVVWSSWCGQGRIIDTVSFDRLRLILNFSHAHTHKVCQRQAPVTRYSAAKNFSLPSARGSRSPPQTFRRGTTTFARKKKLGAIATGRIRAYGGTSMPRYYYFGVEFTCLYRTEDGRNHRRRRVMMFATDVQHDLITWLQFLSDVEVKKVRETVCGGGSQGTKRARKSKQCMSPNVSYFLNESDCTAVDTSNETSLASSSPLDIDTTMDPAVAPSRASDREVEAPGQSIFSLFSSTVTDPTKSPSPQPIEKEQSEEVISNGSLLDISLHNNESPQLAARPHTPKKKKASLKKVKKKTYEELRNERMMRENTELKKKNEELKKEIKVATDKITELQRNHQASERTNRYAEEECEHLRDSLLKVEKQKANLAKKLSESTGNEFQLQKQAVELHATLEEQAACIRALSEQIAAADAYLRDAEGECGSLAGLLGLSTAEDGGDLGTGSGGLSLSNGALRIAERLRLACSAVHDLEQELKASRERERASIEECDRLRNELQKLESQRSDLEESLNAAEALECALRRQLHESLEEVRSAENALSAAEQALRCIPSGMDQYARDADGGSVSNDDSRELPTLALPARIEGVTRQACEFRDEMYKRHQELLDLVARGVCNEDALARVRELRCAKEAVETELQDTLREAEKRLCVVTACEGVLGETLCSDVVEQRQAELLCALRADVAEACGVSGSHVIDATIADDGSNVTFRVAHPYCVPAAAVLARVDSCAFDRVRRVNKWSCGDSEAVSFAEEDEAEREFVAVGTPAGEAFLARITELSGRFASVNGELRAAEDALAERPAVVVCGLEQRVSETNATVEEQAACIRALSEQIAAADAYLRDAEGECGSLAGLLGLSPAEDGGDLGTGSGGLSLSNGALRIAERLRLACSAVHDLEQELKASRERERASIEECDRLRNELQKLESQRSDLEESLNAAEALECALRRQLHESLEEVRSAENALSAAEQALRCIPSGMDQYARDADGGSVSNDDSRELPTLALPARIEGVTRQACEFRDEMYKRHQELLDLVARGVCNEDALARVRELRCAKEAVETELQDTLREAEKRLCVVTACEGVLGETLCSDVVEQRQAELLCALRADVAEACGVSGSHVIDATIADDGSNVTFRVAHPYCVPAAAVLARVDSCAFDRVRRVNKWSCGDSEAVSFAEEDEAEREFVAVGTPAGEAFLARITELSGRFASVNGELRAAEDALAERPAVVVCGLEQRVSETNATVEEQAACIRALSEQIAAADAYLRDAEGECGSLAGLLGLSPAEDGGDLGTGSGGLSLSNGALRIAERLRLACSAVHDLEQELKASRERERASIEECDRLRNELQKLESQRSDLEESLNAAEIPEQILRGHVDSFLCRVFTSLKCLRDVVAGFAVFMCSDVDVDGSPFLSLGQEGTLEKNIDLSLYRLELLVPTIDVLCRGLVGLCRFYEADRLSLMNGLTGLGVEPGGLVLNSVIPCADARCSLSGTLVDIVSAAGDISVVGDFGGNDNSVAEGGTKSLLQAVGVWQTSVEEFSAEEQCSYSKVVAGIVGGFRDEGIAARRALVNVRKALEGKVPCRDDVIDGNVVASQGSDLETSEGREVVRLIAEQRKSVLFALTSLLSSVSADGVERAMRLSKNVPFSDLVLLLRHECVNVSKAFMSLNAIVQEGSNIAIVTSGECGESSQPGSSVTGFTEVKGDNVVPSKTSAAIENVSSPDLAPSQSAGGEGGKLHTGKGPASASDSAMDSTVASAGICAVDGTPSHSTSLSRCPSVAAEDTDERADLLFSIRDFVEAEEASGKPLAIVQQVREHIHARTEELQQLRTAAVKSVETLSGDPLPAGAKPYDVAGALLAAVKTTSDSIGGVHALLSGVTLEEAPAQATRSLKPKAKPQPVGRCNSSIVLSLKRAVLLNPRLAQAGGRRSRESVQMGLSTASRSAGNRSSVSGNSSSGGGGASVGPQKLHELIKAIESKLKIVQHTRDTCSVCLYLLGDKEGGNVPAEELPTRLLLQAQDLFSGLTQIQNLDLGDEDDEPNADDKSSEGNSLVGKPSWITSRLLKVAKVFRSLQYINESMKQREAVAEKQRSFLLLDVNELRNTHAEEKRRLQDMLEGAKVQLRERDLNIKDMQQQNAILRADYDKACAESKHMTLELNEMRGTLDDLQHWLEGVETAAGVVRRSSAAVWGQICSVEQKLTERLSTFIPTDHGHYRRTSKTNVEEKMEVSLTARETGGEVELVPVSGGKLVVQLVEDSASCLRQCEESLQLLERPLILVPALSEWIKQQYLSLKDNVSHAEEEVRSILRSCYRSAADLLYDKLRAVQRHREAELELDASHARWQGRLRDIEAAHKEHTAVLNRRLATMWDLTTQQDVLRAETARWQACAEAAAEETERLRVLLRAAESREVPQPTEVVKIIEVEPPRAPKPSTREVSIMTDLLIVEEPAVPDYDEATDVLKIRAELSDALEYAKHQADDAARCRSLMQEQLHLLDGGQGAVVDPSLSLGKLIETHKKRLLMHVDERRKLLEAWQTAQHNISRLKQEIDERERQRKKETRELETQIKELRVRVQRKLEMDMITERQIAEAERSIDREFEELCRRALSGLSVAAHLQQLRSSLMARIRMQMEAQRPRH
ncbi:hypothetical protein, conserved [Trypanosoma brucei gambiense DAL972]|uniref:Flagellar attachment zone protein 1 conserved domain-containing protein n=1 Tax=Trypanosoma brucei gambiense (strain MHOM/CI/86/DAL972) TaxID=679716 RepID=C9ZNP0_TRYB9|nr:hypothetical protein, conserved [Trypanosoma brucei gambiense DAL972]CBH11018.1 hypothetical protein, conserved [Trypanosoma brucei gambiense DAL972]|eukprot:XP_011773305.1 hypothetical protein, conserved [Trypanosoma brucei gambiense DAL972]